MRKVALSHPLPHTLALDPADLSHFWKQEPLSGTKMACKIVALAYFVVFSIWTSVVLTNLSTAHWTKTTSQKCLLLNLCSRWQSATCKASWIVDWQMETDNFSIFDNCGVAVNYLHKSSLATPRKYGLMNWAGVVNYQWLQCHVLAIKLVYTCNSYVSS
jgi:hypothetical protein